MRFLLGRWLRLPLPVPKQRFHLLHHVVPIELPCNREKHIIRLIASSPEIEQILPLQSAHTLGCTQTEATKSTAAIEVRSCQVKNAAHWLIVAPTNLLQNNAAHLLQFILREGGHEEQFVHKVQRCFELRIDDSCPHLRRLQARAGTFTCPQRLKCFIQRPRIFTFRALKEHI